MSYRSQLISHYEQIWHNSAQIVNWTKGPISELEQDFCVLEFSPTENRDMWTYATCCMSKLTDLMPIELHIFSKEQSNELVELLTITAHFHRNDQPLNLNHTVNFGKPWQNQSMCDHGLISLPYLDGPELENLCLKEYDNKTVKFYWLLPVTRTEINYAKDNGIDSLEQKFEMPGFNYLDVHRQSVV